MRYIFLFLLPAVALGSALSDLDLPVPTEFDAVLAEDSVQSEAVNTVEPTLQGSLELETISEGGVESTENVSTPELEFPELKRSFLPQRLDLDTAERLALENSAALKSQRANAAYLRAAAHAENAVRNPQLRAQYGNRDRGTSDTSESDSETTQSGEVALRFYVPNIYTGGAVEHSMMAGSEAELARCRALEWCIRCDVRQLMLDITYFDKQLELQKELIDVVKSTKERVEQLKVLGEMTAFDSIDANLDHLQAVKQRERINRELIQAAGSLMLLTGLENPSQWRIRYARLGSLVSLGKLDDIRLLERTAEQNRAEIISGEHELHAAAMMLSAEKRKNMPWIDFIQVGYEQNDLSSSDDTTWSVQAAIELPFVSAVSRSGRRKYLRNVEKTEIDLQAIRSQVRVEVNEALFTLQAAIRNRITVREEVNPVIREVKQAIADSSEELAQKDYLVYRIKAKLIEAELEKLGAEYVLRCAMLNLERVVGADL